jgi:hypothetical protein
LSTKYRFQGREMREMRMETNNQVTNSVRLNINLVLEGILKEERATTITICARLMSR